MDRGNKEWDPNEILGVLARGKEQTRQLESRLVEPDPSTLETCKSLVQQIQSTFQTAIAMAKGTRQLPGTKNAGPGSPQSDSPRSSENPERSEFFKKRKNMPKWSRQIGVRTEEDIEGRLEDGYSWRKYGQKDILGAKYPRGYYRCTHRNSMGCLATKQVQRCDDDASTFDVTYRGAHTCRENRTVVAAEEPKMQENASIDGPVGQQDQQLLLQSLREKLRVRTEDLDTVRDLSSFSFPSGTDLPDSISSHSTMENCFMSAFMSDSNYFSLSPCNTTHFDVGGARNPPAQETGFADMISAANSPVAGMDFGLRRVEFEPDDFPFDGSSIF